MITKEQITQKLEYYRVMMQIFIAIAAIVGYGIIDLLKELDGLTGKKQAILTIFCGIFIVILSLVLKFNIQHHHWLRHLGGEKDT